MKQSGKLLQVGIITAAHGIRGQVKVRGNIEQLRKISSYSDATGKPLYNIAWRGETGGQLIAAIEGVSNRNAAEMLKGCELFVPAQKLPKPKKNQYYHGDLVGLEARLENGKRYGQVKEVHNFGAGDIIEIKLAKGDEEMLPFAGKFFGEVNTQEGYVVVFPPDYVEAKE